MSNRIRILYKLTTQDNKTRKGEFNETLWGPGVTHEPKELGIPVLCSPTVIHAYEHPLIAVFMNSRHANLLGPKLWMCKGEPVVFDADLKCGCSSLTTCQEIPLPGITTDQYAQIAKCAAKSAAKYAKCAAKYAAKSAAKYAKCAKYAAESAAKCAAEAAKYAKYAAESAGYAAEAAEYAKSAEYTAGYAAEAAKYAESAEYTAECAKYTAEYAKSAAKYANKPFSLLEILLKVISE